MPSGMENYLDSLENMRLPKIRERTIRSFNDVEAILEDITSVMRDYQGRIEFLTDDELLGMSHQPGRINGYEIAKTIRRQLSQHSHTPVLVKKVSSSGNLMYTNVCSLCGAMLRVHKDGSIEQKSGHWIPYSSLTDKERQLAIDKPERQRFVGPAINQMISCFVDMLDSTVESLRRSWYHSYLRSDRWLAFRKDMFRLWGNKCGAKGCSNDAQHLHHINYDNLGCERAEDVIPVCRVCHKIADEIRVALVGSGRRFSAIEMSEALRVPPRIDEFGRARVGISRLDQMWDNQEGGIEISHGTIRKEHQDFIGQDSKRD